MHPRTLPLTALRPHPDNANVMSDALFKKLVEHLRMTDQYPPIIVRPIGDAADSRYQILDGHHRVKALQKLDRTDAQCVVWEVDDDRALVLLATLNRLQGEDDPHKRGALIARLNQTIPTQGLAKLLPEEADKLDRLAALSHPPKPVSRPARLDAMPVAVHFFLLPDQRKAVEDKLRSQGGSREHALLKLLNVGDDHE